MTPTTVMLIGAISGALALIALLLNFFALFKHNGGVGLGMILHLLFGLWAGASWITFLIGCVMFLIDYAKHG